MKFGHVEMHMLHQAPGMDPVEQLIREIEAQLEGQGWDQKPLYLALGRNRAGLAASTLMVPDVCYEDPAGTLPIYVTWLRGGRLDATRETLAAAGGDPDSIGTRDDPNTRPQSERNEFLRRLLPEDFCGVGMFGEGWGLSATKDSGKTQEYIEASERREIHSHPDRVEVRFGVFVLTDGRILHISRTRGEFPELLDSEKETNLQRFDGRIPDALRLLCSACEDALS